MIISRAKYTTRIQTESRIITFIVYLMHIVNIILSSQDITDLNTIM